MLNPDLPHRTSLVGPPVPLAVDVPVELIELVADGLRAWDPSALPQYADVPVSATDRSADRDPRD
ncbi:hypothetical protein ACQP1G_04100 [Nocardia sp. CA-107356]|uniref:hypothetical protein n=1 Tax=Nocardia sp. CA-107356 TaxID=3239972 RepID=UPI003D8FE94B